MISPGFKKGNNYQLKHIYNIKKVKKYLKQHKMTFLSTFHKITKHFEVNNN